MRLFPENGHEIIFHDAKYHTVSCVAHFPVEIACLGLWPIFWQLLISYREIWDSSIFFWHFLE